MRTKMDMPSGLRALFIRSGPRVCIEGRTFQAYYNGIQSNARTYASNSPPSVPEDKNGPNMETLPNITEETAGMKQATGESPPEMEQGTPIQEVVARDKDAQEKLPRVMKEQLKAQSESKRSFSTYTRRFQELVPLHQGSSSQYAAAAIEGGIIGRNMQQVAPPTDDMSNSIALPDSSLDGILELKPQDAFTRRYPAIIDQFVGLIMQHGKKAAAQKRVAQVLSLLRSSPPPKIRADRPLLPGHPPAAWLPLNPITYLTLAIDSLAPLIRIRALKGMAGGGSSVLMPKALSVRQRRRQAFVWIIDAGSKRKDKTFAHRLADQIIAVVEGRSSVWDRRMNLHKMGVVSRSNVGIKFFKSGKRRDL